MRSGNNLGSFPPDVNLCKGSEPGTRRSRCPQPELRPQQAPARAVHLPSLTALPSPLLPTWVHTQLQKAAPPPGHTQHQNQHLLTPGQAPALAMPRLGAQLVVTSDSENRWGAHDQAHQHPAFLAVPGVCWPDDTLLSDRAPASSRGPGSLSPHPGLSTATCCLSSAQSWTRSQP